MTSLAFVVVVLLCSSNKEYLENKEMRRELKPFLFLQ